MQGAALDQGEVGVQGAHLRLVLDAPDQVLIARVVLVDQRRAGAVGVVDQQVDQIAVERGQPLAVEEFFRRCGAEDIQALFDDVALDLVEEARHLGQLRVARLQFGELALDGGARHCLVELLDLLVVLAAGRRHLLQGLAQHLAQVLAALLDLLALGGIELVEAFGVEHLAVLQRRQGEAGRGAQQEDAGLAGLRFDLAEQLLLAGLELVLQRLHGVAVLVAVEGRRQRGEQAAHQRAHVGLQAAPGAGGQAQYARLVRGAEVVDVAPVAGARHLTGLLFEQLADDGVLAQPRRAHHVEVVALVTDADAEVQGAQRPLLAEAAGQVGEVGGAVEAQRRDLAGVIELRCGEFVSEWQGGPPVAGVPCLH